MWPGADPGRSTRGAPFANVLAAAGDGGSASPPAVRTLCFALAAALRAGVAVGAATASLARAASLRLRDAPWRAVAAALAEDAGGLSEVAAPALLAEACRIITAGGALAGEPSLAACLAPLAAPGALTVEALSLAWGDEIAPALAHVLTDERGESALALRTVLCRLATAAAVAKGGGSAARREVVGLFMRTWDGADDAAALEVADTLVDCIDTIVREDTLGSRSAAAAGAKRPVADIMSPSTRTRKSARAAPGSGSGSATVTDEQTGGRGGRGELTGLLLAVAEASVHAVERKPLGALCLGLRVLARHFRRQGAFPADFELRYLGPVIARLAAASATLETVTVAARLWADVLPMVPLKVFTNDTLVTSVMPSLLAVCAAPDVDVVGLLVADPQYDDAAVARELMMEVDGVTASQVPSQASSKRDLLQTLVKVAGVAGDEAAVGAAFATLAGITSAVSSGLRVSLFAAALQSRIALTRAAALDALPLLVHTLGGVERDRMVAELPGLLDNLFHSALPADARLRPAVARSAASLVCLLTGKPVAKASRHAAVMRHAALPPQGWCAVCRAWQEDLPSAGSVEAPVSDLRLGQLIFVSEGMRPDNTLEARLACARAVASLLVHATQADLAAHRSVVEGFTDLVFDPEFSLRLAMSSAITVLAAPRLVAAFRPEGEEAAENGAGPGGGNFALFVLFQRLKPNLVPSAVGDVLRQHTMLLAFGHLGVVVPDEFVVVILITLVEHLVHADATLRGTAADQIRRIAAGRSVAAPELFARHGEQLWPYVVKRLVACPELVAEVASLLYDRTTAQSLPGRVSGRRRAGGPCRT